MCDFKVRKAAKNSNLPEIEVECTDWQELRDPTILMLRYHNNDYSQLSIESQQDTEPFG